MGNWICLYLRILYQHRLDIFLLVPRSFLLLRTYRYFKLASLRSFHHSIFVRISQSPYSNPSGPTDARIKMWKQTKIDVDRQLTSYLTLDSPLFSVTDYRSHV